MLINLLFYFQSILPGLLLWAGLYILSRTLHLKGFTTARLSQLSTTSAFSLISYSFFYFGAAVRSPVRSPEDYLFWVKLTWWAGPLGILLGFITVYNIFSGQQTPSAVKNRIKRLVFLLAALYTVLVAFLGTFTDVIFEYSDIRPILVNAQILRLFVPPGRLFWLGALQGPLLTWGSVGIMLSSLTRQDAKHSHPQEYRPLLLITVLLALGSTLAAGGYSVTQMAYTEGISSVLVFIALVVFIQAVFLHNMGMESRVLKIDMFRSLMAVGIISILYSTGLALIHATTLSSYFDHPGLYTSLIYLTALLHTPTRVNQTIADGILPHSLLQPWERQYMEKMSDLKHAIITAVDPATALTIANQEMSTVIRSTQTAELSAMIDQQINQIFRHKSFENEALLSQSRLLELKILKKRVKTFAKSHSLLASQLTLAQRARILRKFLFEQIKSMWPEAPNPPGEKPSIEEIDYILLGQRYILGKTQSEVSALLEQIGVVATGGAYARHLQNARQRLSNHILRAEVLFRQEDVKRG